MGSPATAIVGPRCKACREEIGPHTLTWFSPDGCALMHWDCHKGKPIARPEATLSYEIQAWSDLFGAAQPKPHWLADFKIVREVLITPPYSPVVPAMLEEQEAAKQPTTFKEKEEETTSVTEETKEATRIKSYQDYCHACKKRSFMRRCCAAGHGRRVVHVDGHEISMYAKRVQLRMAMNKYKRNHKKIN